MPALATAPASHRRRMNALNLMKLQGKDEREFQAALAFKADDSGKQRNLPSSPPGARDNFAIDSLTVSRCVLLLEPAAAASDARSLLEACYGPTPLCPTRTPGRCMELYLHNHQPHRRRCGAIKVLLLNAHISRYVNSKKWMLKR